MRSNTALSWISCVFYLAIVAIAAGLNLKTVQAADVYTHDNTADILISQGGQAAVDPDNALLAADTDGSSVIPIIHFVLHSKGSISGLVWNDTNGNQKVDEGESGVREVMIYVDYDGSTSYTPGDPFTSTDESGRYTLPRVRAGSRSVYMDISTLPTGFEITTFHPQTVNLDRRQLIEDADFGIRDASSRIEGYVWNDSNRNGIIDIGEAALPGVSVYVDLNSDDVYTLGEPNAVTGSDGFYRISRINPGTFTVHLDNGTLPAGYHTTPVQGINPSLVNFSSSRTETINFGYQMKVAISGVLRDATGRTWANIVLFIDLNGNGIYDIGEPMATTDMFGRYVFGDLLAGTYAILIKTGQLPTGYDILLEPGVVTTSQGKSYTYDFVSQARKVDIIGYAWSDENGSGKREENEDGLAGITVFLDANGNGTKEAGEVFAITDSNGDYLFTNQDHGTYTVRAVDGAFLEGYARTTANPVTSSIGPGETFTSARFGYQRNLAPVNSTKYPTRMNWAGDGMLYVSDHLVGSVFVYDTSLTIKSELKGLVKPLGVATDSSGTIYVGTEGSMGVEVYSPAAKLVTTIGAGTIDLPNDLDFDKNGNLYVLDSADDQVLVFDPSSPATPTAIIGSSAVINYATSIDVNYRDPGTGEIGELYIADQPKCLIHVYSLDGTFKQSIGGCGYMWTKNWDGLFSGLVAVAGDHKGNIHGLDNGLNRVHIFDAQTGSYKSSYDAYPAGHESLLNLHSDLAINQTDYQVDITNIATKRVEKVYTIP